jgi:hypothetical protein
MTSGGLTSLLVLTTLGATYAKHAVTIMGRLGRWPRKRIARAAGGAESFGVGLGLAVWLAIHSL